MSPELDGRFLREPPTGPTVSARTWSAESGHSLNVEETTPTDTTIWLWGAYPTGDGVGPRLTVGQARELISDLIARVNLISRPALHGTNWDGEEF